jgi:hypothetical protein
VVLVTVISRLVLLLQYLVSVHTTAAAGQTPQYLVLSLGGLQGQQKQQQQLLLLLQVMRVQSVLQQKLQEHPRRLPLQHQLARVVNLLSTHSRHGQMQVQNQPQL